MPILELDLFVNSIIYFNIGHYNGIKDINTKHGMLAHHDLLQSQDKGHNSECYIFGDCLFLTKPFNSECYIFGDCLFLTKPFKYCL